MNNKKKPLTETEILYYLENDDDSDIPDLSDEENYGWIDDSDEPTENIDALEDLDDIEEEIVFESNDINEIDLELDNDEIALESENVTADKENIEPESLPTLDKKNKQKKNKTRRRKNEANGRILRRVQSNYKKKYTVDGQCSI